MLLAIQSFSQLDDRYGRAVKENILANTVNHLLLPGAGLEETEYYSQRLGLTTITTESRSATSQPSRSGNSYSTMPMFMNSTSTGHTQGQSQRSLQTADELRTMKKGTILFVNASSPAAMLRARGYFEDRRLAPLANLPFKLDLPQQRPIISVDPREDQENEEILPEATPVSTQGCETSGEQEPIGIELEEEVTTYTVAPDE
jgi:type IV secretory pathway TraG/TraD family ATPase VirD4